MRISDIIMEAQAKQITVVYGGRFQPMHQGHFALYNKLVSKFGADNVFIATMFGKEAAVQHNKGDYTKNPFTFEEKASIINKMFGIKNVVQTSPYRPDLAKMGRDPNNSAVVLVFSAKDAGRLKSSPSIKPLPDDLNELQTYYDEGNLSVAYMMEMPIEQGGMSATDFRNTMAQPDIPEESKMETFKKFFGKFDQEIYNFIKERLSQ